MTANYFRTTTNTMLVPAVSYKFAQQPWFLFVTAVTQEYDVKLETNGSTFVQISRNSVS
jgi:hypothetical protein